MIASLPMYDWPEVREANDTFWEILAEELTSAGFNPPDALNRDWEGDAHWLHPNLLFSQTCGYPYATRLSGKVQLLATPCYSVAGCEGPTYSSAIIVRCDAKANSLEDVLSGRLAFNCLDSLSGYRCFVPLVGDPVAAFSSAIESGGHRKSAVMVAEGKADCAAIDAVCWALFCEFEPEQAAQLRVLRWGPQFPALPYITRMGWSARELTALRRSMSEGVAKVAQNKACSVLHLSGVQHVEDVEYAVLQNLN